MKKKGTEQGVEVFVVVILIMLALIFGLIFLISKVKPATEEAEWKTTCQASVSAHAAHQGLISLVSSKPNIICPPQDLVIDEDLSTEKGQAQAKAEIAEAMATCWEIFGLGKKELFGPTDGRFCAPCYIVNFTGKAVNKEIDGFYNYLLTEKVPGKGQTYFDYLGGYKTSQAEAVLNQLGAQSLAEQKILTQNTYAVVFFYVKGEEQVNAFIYFMLYTYETMKKLNCELPVAQTTG